MRVFLGSGDRFFSLSILALGHSFFNVLRSFFLEFFCLETEQLIRVLEFGAKVKRVTSTISGKFEGGASRSNAELNWTLSESDCFSALIVD